MRTLKIFVTTVSLFLFAVPVTAANYPPEMPDIKNAPVQFVCETPSLLFVKIYISKTYDIWISGRNQKEMAIGIATDKGRKVFWFVPSTNEWRQYTPNLSQKEKEEIKEYSDGEVTEEENETIHSCIKSNLRSRGLLQ